MVKTLVFVHGWAGTPAAWEYQRRYFGRSYSVITPDIGYAKNIQEAAGIICKVASKDEHCVFIGWSLGWFAILEALRSFNSKPAAAVSVCSTAKFLDDGYLGTGPTKTHLAKMMRDLASHPQNVLDNFYTLFLLSPVGRRIFQGACQEKIDVRALLAGLEMLQISDYRDFITTIDIPTFLIAGLKDTICPPEASVYMHKSIKGSQLKIFDCGHAPFLSNTAEFNSAVENFIKKL